MKATVVRYQTKPERADENQTLVEQGAAHASSKQPPYVAHCVLPSRCGGYRSPRTTTARIAIPRPG